ncbi:DUF6508 domain-containing protein [Sutcliffiella cohnii]|uniref:DUF6508 domain-containing protein n=1 Tax=Sutcliffiella cohnii TaxID=33932 RepID=UPI002E1EF31E|nr:DUF6508 domain-containing protein [Sutcliffiella cohnii]
MVKYEKLINYISYFDNDLVECCSWTSTSKGQFAYPDYEEVFLNFIDECNSTDLIVHDYFEVLKEIDREDYEKKIAEADLHVLKAVLTHYIRAERFSEGSWDYACKRGIFLKILYRLKELNT